MISDGIEITSLIQTGAHSFKKTKRGAKTKTKVVMVPSCSSQALHPIGEKRKYQPRQRRKKDRSRTLVHNQNGRPRTHLQIIQGKKNPLSYLFILRTRASGSGLLENFLQEMLVEIISLTTWNILESKERETI